MQIKSSFSKLLRLETKSAALLVKHCNVKEMQSKFCDAKSDLREFTLTLVCFYVPIFALVIQQHSHSSVTVTVLTQSWNNLMHS